MTKLEMFLGHPIFLIGALVDRICKKTNPSQLFFFIPVYHTGGAEQVHVDILKIFAAERPWVVLTHKSNNDYHRATMQSYAELIEIGKYYNNQNRFFVKYFFLGYFTSLIKRHPRSILVSSNCGMLYDLCNYLKSGYKIDIFHGFCGVETRGALRQTPVMNKRVLVSYSAKNELLALYDRKGFRDRYSNRLVVIHNSIWTEETLLPKDYTGILKIVFVARNSHEKRYHLYEQIAHDCAKKELPAKFSSIGDFASTDYVTCLGELTTRDAVYNALYGFHLLVLCSISEGFGLVVAEAMACGVVPLATDCGGVREIFTDGETGHLVKSDEESDIVTDFVKLIETYAQDPSSLEPMGKAAFSEVKAKFSYQNFNKQYYSLISEARKELDSQ